MDKIGGDWSKITVLVPETGEFYNRYFYKRKPAYRILVDTPKAKALAAYTLIEKDLRSTLVWLENISDLLSEEESNKKTKGNRKSSSDRNKYNLIKGLFVAALTFYGKSFATCEGRRVKLDKANLDSKFHSEHDNIIEMRHNFAAHSGAKNVERVHVVLALDKNMKKNTQPYFGRELAQPDSYVKKDIEDFIGLVNHAKEFVDKKIDVLSGKILQDDVASKGPEYWYNKT